MQFCRSLREFQAIFFGSLPLFFVLRSWDGVYVRGSCVRTHFGFVSFVFLSAFNPLSHLLHNPPTPSCSPLSPLITHPLPCFICVPSLSGISLSKRLHCQASFNLLFQFAIDLVVVLSSLPKFSLHTINLSLGFVRDS